MRSVRSRARWRSVRGSISTYFESDPPLDEQDKRRHGYSRDHLLPEEGELYVFAKGADRIAKERSMRRRQLKWLWARLAQLQGLELTRA
jgi:hypothetical protein